MAGRVAGSEAVTRRAVLIATTLTSFLTPFMDSATNVALPEISARFGQAREGGGPFRSFEDFLRRARVDPSDSRILIKAGCFDSVTRGRSRAELAVPYPVGSGRDKQ